MIHDLYLGYFLLLVSISCFPFLFPVSSLRNPKPSNLKGFEVYSNSFKLSRDFIRNSRYRALPEILEEGNGAKHGRAVDCRANMMGFASALLAAPGALTSLNSEPVVWAKTSFHFCWTTCPICYSTVVLCCLSACAGPTVRLGHSKPGVLLLGWMTW